MVKTAVDFPVYDQDGGVLLARELYHFPKGSLVTGNFNVFKGNVVTLEDVLQHMGIRIVVSTVDLDFHWLVFYASFFKRVLLFFVFYISLQTGRKVFIGWKGSVFERGGGVKRGQAGIEYVILIGILLLFFIPIIYYSLTEASKSVKLGQLENMVTRLGKAVDAVYALGPHSREIIPVTIPEGVESASVTGHEILLRVAGIEEVLVITKAQVTGTLPITKGTYFIIVEAQPSGIVNVQQR